MNVQIAIFLHQSSNSTLYLEHYYQKKSSERNCEKCDSCAWLQLEASRRITNPPRSLALDQARCRQVIMTGLQDDDDRQYQQFFDAVMRTTRSPTPSDEHCDSHSTVILTPASSPRSQPQQSNQLFGEFDNATFRDDVYQIVAPTSLPTERLPETSRRALADQVHDAPAAIPCWEAPASGRVRAPIGELLYHEVFPPNYPSLQDSQPGSPNSSTSYGWVSSYNDMHVPHGGHERTIREQSLQLPVESHSRFGEFSQNRTNQSGGTRLTITPDFHTAGNGFSVAGSQLPQPSQNIHNSLIRSANEQPWTPFNIPHETPTQAATSSSSRPQRSSGAGPSQRNTTTGRIAKTSVQQNLKSKATSSIQAVVTQLLDLPSPTSAGGSPQSLVKTGYGGRMGPLEPQKREKAGDLRIEVACWICALQRVSCSKGAVCTRCADRLSGPRPDNHPLTCVRTVLEDMVDQFMSRKMTQIHDPGVVEGFVKANVGHWVGDIGGRGAFNVSMTVGYGPALELPMEEFVPSREDIVCQMQWVKGVNGVLCCVYKMSPPLALRISDTDISSRIRDFIDRVIEHDLESFRETYCEDQNDDLFRTAVFNLLCQLFKKLPQDRKDDSLRSDLKRSLSFIVATDMMLHHVTLKDESRDAVISQMRNHNDPSKYNSFTSPKVANRQLKSAISKIQGDLCRDILIRLQKILRMGKGTEKKRARLSSFVLMLAMAMCQEETEHNRWLRAEGDIKRSSGPPMDMQAIRDQAVRDQAVRDQARRDCRTADDGFDFLTKLFNCKYSPAKRYQALLSDWLKEPYNAGESQFLEAIRLNHQENEFALLQRKELEICSAGDNRYKSRLLAQLLVPFMVADHSTCSKSRR